MRILNDLNFSNPPSEAVSPDDRGEAARIVDKITDERLRDESAGSNALPNYINRF